MTALDPASGLRLPISINEYEARCQNIRKNNNKESIVMSIA